MNAPNPFPAGADVNVAAKPPSVVNSLYTKSSDNLASNPISYVYVGGHCLVCNKSILVLRTLYANDHICPNCAARLVAEAAVAPKEKGK